MVKNNHTHILSDLDIDMQDCNIKPCFEKMSVQKLCFII